MVTKTGSLGGGGLGNVPDAVQELADAGRGNQLAPLAFALNEQHHHVASVAVLGG